MKSICVYCGSSDAVSQDYLAAAHQMGAVLAQRGFRLIFGGGKTGLMGAVADGTLEAGGEAYGVIIPSMHTDPLAHNGLTRMDVVPGMHERKARMHELSDGYVALPGGFGTFEELFETLTWAQIGEHRKPIGLLNVKNYFAPLYAALGHAVAEGFIFREHFSAMKYENDPGKLLDAMSEHQHPTGATQRWMREA